MAGTKHLNIYTVYTYYTKMANITLAVPDELKKEMDQFPDMNWSEVARASIRKRVVLLEKFRQFTKDSELTEEDAIRIGRKVNEGLSKRYK